jgi:hypothetical protein
MEQGEFECYCGEKFDDREELIQHNVDKHDWDLERSRRAVAEKYPQ